jgi:uncharacterized small protein (DUF1192 family)
MADFSSLSSSELAGRIAILRDNIRQITEQAASQYNDELEGLLKEQERRLGR